jgi:hypothetical protein
LHEHFDLRSMPMRKTYGPGRYWRLAGAILAVAMGTAVGASYIALPAGAAASGALQDSTAIQARIECAALLDSGLPGIPHVPDFQEILEAPTRITSARIVATAGNQPEYCEVSGYVQPQIKFQLRLPVKTWQGRYLQHGCAGLCGAIRPPAFPACGAELGGDFAVAATNNGHDSAHWEDALWAGFHEQARIDYGSRAVHVVAVAAKAIIQAYYGRPPTRSYWMGCSAGGREGLMEAQRYPRDFDGIIAGAPASLQTFNPLFMAWVLRTNTDPNGRPILTADKLAPLHAAVVKACDANDGVVGDGLIGDPRDCDFDPVSIQCAGADGADCLTAEQVRVVQTLYTGNFDPQGRRLDPRVLPRGSELTWLGFWIPPVTTPAGLSPQPVVAAWRWGDNTARWFSFPIGQGKPLTRVRLTVEEFRRMAPAAKYYEPLDPDLRAFRDAGGKLMIYSGWGDWGVTPSQTLMYYDAVRRAMGGQEATDRFVRLFMVPGMSHCGGGPTPDTSEMLRQMVKWVEEGEAPESILAHDRNPLTNAVRHRPVFRYPLAVRYIGPDPKEDPTGPDKAENFVAAPAAKPHRDSIDWVGDFLLTPGARADASRARRGAQPGRKR